LCGARSAERGAINIRSKKNIKIYGSAAESLGIIFKDYMSNHVKSLQIKGKNKVYTNYRLKTNSLPIFNQYYEMFYKFNSDTQKYIKIIPENIIDLVDPIVLAYLIMTDGNFDKSRKRVRIYTNSFRKDEVQNLAINKNLGIYTTLRSNPNITFG
jgi:hypothetical protein